MRSLQANKDSGFTLIELMIVLAIIAMILVIAIPRVAGALDRVGLVAALGTHAVT